MNRKTVLPILAAIVLLAAAYTVGLAQGDATWRIPPSFELLDSDGGLVAPGYILERDNGTVIVFDDPGDRLKIVELEGCCECEAVYPEDAGTLAADARRLDPTDVPGPTTGPDPEPTATQPAAPEPTATRVTEPTPTAGACNRGLGNGLEDCDPGNSGGQPGKAGETDG